MSQSENWEQFDDVFSLENSLGSLVPYTLEVTLNHPQTVLWKKNVDKENSYKELFIDLINELHSITGTVTESNYVFENASHLHLHGFINYYHNGNVYGLLEQLMKFMLTKVKPGRSKENSWNNVRHYPYPCLSCPFISLSLGPKEKYNGWVDYINKHIQDKELFSQDNIE